MLGKKINHRVAMSLRFAMMNENSIFKSGTENTGKTFKNSVPSVSLWFNSLLVLAWPG
jgi:hypothetical protein